MRFVRHLFLIILIRSNFQNTNFKIKIIHINLIYSLGKDYLRYKYNNFDRSI